jgi:MoaA/NifB/PqqE/SkfB family radical SAM enzyme
VSAVGEAVADGTLPGRVWFYSNYHCNLECTYCLTESGPRVPRRQLPTDLMLSLAHQAAELGFTDFGVTGGEPFLRPDLVEVLTEMSDLLPTIVLTNGTVFDQRRFTKASRLAGRPIAIQISLDAPEPDLNDEMRGPENFAKVVDVVPRLVDAGVRVRIATTVEPDRLDEDQHARLCELHRSMGVPDDDHVVRSIVRRGRAVDHDMGVTFDHFQLPAELTVSTDGAFWSPFGPTVLEGVLDTDLLITRTVDPLATPAGALLELVSGRPEGADATLGIR